MIKQDELKLDYIFIPRYVSINKKHYFCPKFMALPDTVRNTIKPKIPILEWDLNAKKQSNIESAIEQTLADGYRTADIFASDTILLSTSEMTDKIVENID